MSKDIKQEDLKDEPTSDDDYDPSLDITSDKFDPLKAIYAKNIKLPNPKAPVLDNISKFKMCEGNVVVAKSVVRSGAAKSTDEPGTSGTATQPIRRFLPHQEPIQCAPFVRRNVITRMEEMVGPLAALTKCLRPGIKITIHTRRAHEVRGTLNGTLEAFDKHWNLALSDVYEEWTRRRFTKAKVPALGCNTDTETSRQQNKIKFPIPTVNILKSNSKTETCSRHVGQMLVRGEHVVIIVINVNKMDIK